jgi:WD40 repeat protein/class 3 adenylate cyclase/energy-coupling factor transporter ATP-binding protein EcfA2
MLVFLFTDIEGSSKLWEAHTGVMTAIIARHDEILQQTVRSAGGRITKHTGDGITAVFQTAGQPVACALEAQVRFATEAWGEIGELRIRAGLHAGEAEFHLSAGTAEGDYFGPPVNATARVMSAAWGGQVLLTPEVTRVSPLPPGATLLDLGEHLLKNVSAPQQLYQLDHPSLPWHQFPPPRTLSGQSIRQAVDERGGQMAALEPQAMGISLLVATLLPALQGELDPESGALEGNLGVLEDLGALSLRGFVAGFAGRLRAGRPLPAYEVGGLLQRDLQAQLLAGDERAVALRADAGRLLQAVHGVEAAMAAATGEVKEALARGLADLGTQFGEFRWMLAGVRDTLADVRGRQALQLALQREQLDLQRQQLVKTNLILHRQQPGPALAGALPEVAGADVAPATAAPAALACPYKGLAAFEAEDAEYFFGREELVAELTARLAGTRFLAVVGPSGSGKSSLVRAGLLPAVWGGALPGSEDWQTLALTPGAHPLEELAVRVSLLRGIEPSALHEALRSRPQALHLAIRQALADEPDEVKLLLVVDQFEEIFALCHDEEERQRFIDALLYAVEAQEGRTVVVPTVRADFYGRCAEYPRLAARMSDGLLVGPMSEAELRQAIEGPAAVVGLRLEPGLAEMILDDVAGEPGALPLMSHALLETFARRRGRTLTLSGYAESGGVAGAIAQTADTVYAGLDAGQQALARSIFLRLTELGEEGAQDTRRRVAPSELVRREEEAPAVEALLRTLADARLITTGGPVPSGVEGTVEVAHEALIREWPLLRGWLEEDREGLRIHRHLTEAAQEWARLGREEGELYRGARLAAAGEWAEARTGELNPLERGFLDASQDLALARERERQRRRRRTLWGLAAGLVVALVLALLAGQQWQRASVEEQKALEQAGVLLASQAEAELEAGYGDRAVLLALEALEQYPYTWQAEHALGQAVSYSRALQAHTGHDGAVTSVDWSPDGTRVATSSTDNSVHVWDAATGEELLVIDLPEGITGNIYDYALAVRWTPDGQRLLTLSGDRFLLGSQDYDLLLWDAAPSGEGGAGPEPLAAIEIPNRAEPEEGEGQVTTLGVHYATGAAADVAPDSGRLATVGGDNAAIVWDASLARQELVLTGHENDVNSVDWSPDEAHLVTASEDGTARIWDAQSGEELLVLAGHEGAVNVAGFSPDGSQLATAGDDGTVRLWDAAGDLLGILEPQAGVVSSLAWSADGSYLATGTDDGRIRIWSLPGGEIVAEMGGHNDFVAHLAWSPVDDRLASAGADGAARIWNAAPSTAAQVLPYLTVSDPSWSSDARYLALPTGDSGYGTGEPGRLAIWDAAANQAVTDKLDTGFNLLWFEVDYSPDDRLILAKGLSSWPEGLPDLETIHALDAQTGQEVRSFTVTDGSWIRSCGWSPDGTQVGGGTASGVLYVWDFQTGGLVNTMVGHEADKMINALEWSPDGTRIATAGGDGTARIWDAETGETLFVLAHEAPAEVWSAIWSPDGSRLLTTGGLDDIGAEDNTIRIWDANTGEELAVLRGHASQVTLATWSPDGRRIASSSSDGTTRIWDAETGEDLLTLSTPAFYCPYARWSPDGKYVAVAMEATPAEIWRVWQSTEELVNYARECCVFRELTAAERERFGLPTR